MTEAIDTRPCDIEGCGGKRYGRGLCHRHYQHHWRRGTLPPDRSKVCSIEDCERPHWGRGWCQMHYNRWLRQGDPNVVLAGSTTHGVSRHILYPTWSGMVRRCTWPEYHNYRWYGARGITVHEPWLNDPAAFITWIETNLGERPDGHTLDRIDNDGNYEPGNLRWATHVEQIANSRTVNHA